MRTRSGLRHCARMVTWVALLSTWGCATKQQFPLECVAEQAQVYVDGRLLEQTPDAIRLRADTPHKLYFKREGHEPQLVVLEPTEAPDGSWRLEPSDVCVELVPIGLGRELTIEAEEPDGAP